MSADSRSPITDALATLGMIHTQPEKRDAIHLGVEPVEAGMELRPGEHICLFEGKAYADGSCDGYPLLGIVDPFLDRPVMRGERFWLIVYPRQITSLRHVWEHPNFPASGETADAPVLSEKDHERAMELIDNRKTAARQFVENEATRLGVTPDELIEHASDFVNYSRYWVHGEDGGKFEGVHVSEAFWQHYEIITGNRVPAEKQHSFLDCSC